MSIDDMDIPVSINKQLLSLHTPRAKPYSKRGHNRRASARVHVKPPPKPQRKGIGHRPKRATTPPPKDAKFKFNPGDIGQMQHSQSMAIANRPPPPPRLNRNSQNKISISIEDVVSL